MALYTISIPPAQSYGKEVLFQTEEIPTICKFFTFFKLQIGIGLHYKFWDYLWFFNKVIFGVLNVFG